MTSRRREKVGAFAVAGVMTLVLGACTGDDAVASQGATKLANPTTEPTETGPTVAPDNRPEDSGSRIPPAGTVSTPVEGELIADAYVGFAGQILVYADGRVLSAEAGDSPFVEQRLSPEGVELVRQVLGERVQGDQRHDGLADPALGYTEGAGRLESLLESPGAIWSRQSAWEDREGKPYVPARYAACPHSDLPPGDEAVLDLLPASAQALLRGSDPAMKQGACFELAPGKARSLVAILSETGSFFRDPWPRAVGAWSLSDGKGDRVRISLHGLLPDGRRFPHVPF